MRNRTLALVGAALLGAALVLGTLSTVLAQPQPQWGSVGWGPGGMMGGFGPVMGGPGMMGGFGAPSAPADGLAWGLPMALGWLAALAFLAVLIAGVALLVGWLKSAQGVSGGVSGDSALEILKRRYIAGEINEEEYEDGVKHVLA